MTNSTVQVFTEKSFKGDTATINIGDFNFDTKISKTIIGVAHGKEYKFPYNIEKVNFKNDAIKSLKIGPYLSVTVYEQTDKGGRYINFENNSPDVMNVTDLSTNQYTFADKISNIVVKPLTKANKSFQKTLVLDSEVGESFTSIDTPEEYNMKIVIIIILLVSCTLCLVLGGFFGKSMFNDVRNMNNCTYCTH